MIKRVVVSLLLCALVAASRPDARGQISITVETCGVVTVFVAATAVAPGAIVIGGTPYVIAAGTHLVGEAQVAIGVEMCLSATLNASLEIASGSIALNVEATIDVCGTVDVYIAATASAAGYITIDGIRYDIAAGVDLDGAAAIRIGIRLCLHATVNVLGQVTVGDVVVDPGSTNHAPQVSAPASASIAAGQNLNFSVSGSDGDAGDSVTLTASGLPAGATVTPSPATGNPAIAQFDFTPTPAQANQTFTVTFTGTDTHGASTTSETTITVTASGGTNHAPTISVPGPQTVQPGETLTFVVTASDADGDTVTISASNVPANASFDATTGTFTFTPTAEQAGQIFSIVFTASDDAGASVTDGVLVTVTGDPGGGNQGPPIITTPPSPISVQVGDTLTFVVTATTQIPNCAIQLGATGVPQNGSFTPSSGRFTFTPAADQANRSHTVTFAATDCRDQTSTSTVTIVVTNGGGGGGEGGSMCLSTTQVTFAPAAVGSSCGYVIVAITNEGSGRLTIDGFEFDDGSHFRLEGVVAPMRIGPGSVAHLKLLFVPSTTGSKQDRLRMTSTDGEVSIRLRGRGLRQQ